ncbi:MAG: leucyl aminopeptidase family protein [Bacteroidales bacterium]|jgi:leucyl aminopeptidase|nr:leucyl aminopeptidase family protein [Bacteroidales bacterium]
MISIEKIPNVKKEVSTLLIFKNGDTITSPLLNNEQEGYIATQMKQNERRFFAFNMLSHWIAVAIVSDKKTKYETIEEFRKLGGEMLDFCDKEYVADLQTVFAAHINKEEIIGFVEGVMINSYTFDNYRTDPKRLIHPFDRLYVFNDEITASDIEKLVIVFQSMEKCRDLVNEPVCSLNAEGLAAAFVDLSREAGIEVEVWQRDEIEKKKMGGLLAVNKGSVDTPTFTIMQYKPETAKNLQPLVLVGKGLVYDTGGLNIKTGDYMNDMKEDMAGAAMMATAMYAIARLNLPLYVVGLFPATDNRPSGNAYATGDIINMYDGTNVEVMNTDAEGRIILADALAYAKQFSPMLTLNAATLTGSAARTLGSFGIAAVEKDAAEYLTMLMKSGNEVRERVAEFPFWDDYDELIKSEIADIKNTTETAGMITAGKFLAYFTNYPFIHLDIAGVAMSHKKTPYRGLGATGTGVRLITRFAENLCKFLEN